MPQVKAKKPKVSKSSVTNKSTIRIKTAQAIKGVDRQIAYFMYLRSKEFHERRRKQIEYGLKGIALQAARNTVEVWVYQAWPDPGTRSGDLYRSIKVNVGGGYKKTDAYVEIYSDPRVARAKTLPGFSYAAFFIEPVKFNSFLKPRGKNPNTYRPFFRVWEKFMQTFMPHWIKRKTEAAMFTSLPKSLRGKG